MTLMFNYIYKFLSFSELAFAYASGKGYGRGSIRQENRLIHKMLGRSAVIVIDVGANIGEYTAELRRIYPNAAIHSFEPSSTNIDILSARFSGDHLTKINPVGLADCASSTTLYSDRLGSSLGSLTLRDVSHIGKDFSCHEVVQIIRFEDYWIHRLNSQDIDIIKLDIEGHELQAMHGMGKAIHQTRIIQFEFGGCNIDTRTYFRDFWSFFNFHNFKLYRITPFGLEEITRYRQSDESFSTTNYVATNNDFI